MEALSVRAVSYTHLDVYKRQFLQCRVFSVFKEYREQGPANDLLSFLFLLSNKGVWRGKKVIGDVYKRQPSNPKTEDYTYKQGQYSPRKKKDTTPKVNPQLAVELVFQDVYKRQPQRICYRGYQKKIKRNLTEREQRNK